MKHKIVVLIFLVSSMFGSFAMIRNAAARCVTFSLLNRSYSSMLTLLHSWQQRDPHERAQMEVQILHEFADRGWSHDSSKALIESWAALRRECSESEPQAHYVKTLAAIEESLKDK